MPGIIAALAGAATPFSILTKGPLLRRDLPLLDEASRAVSVGVGVSIAILDPGLHTSLEPGTADPRARLDLVRAVTDAGLTCGVMVAPVLPWLTDSVEHLDDLIGRIAAAGASGATVLPLHLRPGAREWKFAWLAREHPELVGRYQTLYARSAYVPRWYANRLAGRVRPLLQAHGLERSRTRADADVAARRGCAEPEPSTLFG
jgi:DNA repair photolyase